MTAERPPKLKAPFPYFGGKRTVADVVWKHLGNPDNYLEPFAGSLAVLLARPDQPRVETVNDVNCYLANFWRATKHAPDKVVEWADWPVNEADLHARHRWLVLSREAEEFRQRVLADPEYYDPKIAGWWCWGACCWIGGGWCQDSWHSIPALSTNNDICALPQKRQALGGGNNHKLGLGINAWGPSQPSGRPQLADAYDLGRGVNSRGELSTCANRREWLLGWFDRLADRLRLVRVCCGHWLRICDSESVTTRLGTTGIFLDPPYPVKLDSGRKSRSGGLYQGDDPKALLALRNEVLGYCRERGSKPGYRIVLACYEGDGYESLSAEHGWRVVEWEANGGYGNRGRKGKEQRRRERLYCSPGCCFERSLFDGGEA